MTQKLLLALAIALPACDAEDPRGGEAIAPTCAGSKCDDGDEEEEAGACWSSEDIPTTAAIDSGICDRLAAIDPGFVDAAQGRDWTIFDPNNREGDGCWARIANPGAAADLCATNPDVARCECVAGAPSCWIDFAVSSLEAGLADVMREGSEDACYFLGVAQRRCRGELPPTSDAACDTASSCTPSLEVDCVAYAPPWIDSSTAFDAPQSRCTGVTVNGLGYANVVGHDLYGECEQSTTATPARCDVFGQSHSAMDPRLCEVLTACVEPAIDCLRTAPGVYALPSGSQRIGIDLVCGSTQTQGNHQAGLCRALDINVEANGGNIDVVGRVDPEANLDPAFVAVMEECGLRWGGRFNGTFEVKEIGCDPMHFDFAGDCVPSRDPPAGLCDAAP